MPARDAGRAHGAAGAEKGSRLPAGLAASESPVHGQDVRVHDLLDLKDYR